MFAGSKSGSGPNLETWDSAKILGEKTGVAGDDQVVADPEMERGGLALVELANTTLQANLELPQRQNFRGVDLQNGRLAGAFELGAGQGKLGGGQGAGFEDIHER